MIARNNTAAERKIGFACPFGRVMTRTQMFHFGFGTSGLQEYIDIPGPQKLLRVRRIWA
jgi:hypothetical protein